MNLKKIKISQIDFDESQPRKDIINVGELANSINKEGLMNPIEVIPVDKKRYQLIDGERRLRACILLNHNEINAIIKNDVKNVFIRQLVSDFHKEKLNLTEQAEAIRKLENEGNSLKEIKMLLGVGTTKFLLLRKVLKFNTTTKRFITEGTLTANIINNISLNEIDSGKEDEIVKEIVERKAKSRYQINKIILERANIRYIVNKYLTDAYIFEKKTRDFNNKLGRQTNLIEDTIKSTIKSSDENLDNEIKTVVNKLNSILKEIKERRTV